VWGFCFFVDGIPLSADQFRKLFDRTYFNIHRAPLPLKALNEARAQRANGSLDPHAIRTQNALPSSAFLLLLNSPKPTQFLQFSRSKNMRYLHTMLRVRNLDAALKFYQDALGLKEVRRVDNDKAKFTLVFCAPPKMRASSKRPRDAARRWSSSPIIGTRKIRRGPLFRPPRL